MGLRSAFLVPILAKLSLLLLTGTAHAAPLMFAYESTFGTSRLNGPTGLAVDGGGSVYVADDNNNRIQIFDSSGNFERRFGFFSTSRNPGTFRRPIDVALNDSGDIAVADSLNRRIQIFDNTGTFLRDFGGFGEPVPVILNSPRAVDFDSNGNVIVADNGSSFNDNNVLHIFDASGNLIRSFDRSRTGLGSPGPEGLAVDPDDRIIVTDTANNRIRIFDINGNTLDTFGSFGIGEGQFRTPSSVAVDFDGNIAVADANNDRVQVFDKDGVFLTQFGGTGSGPGRFNLPSGIAFDDSGNLYVSDFFTNRVQKFSREGGITSVPEPSSLALLGIGCCGLFGYGWRRKRSIAG